MTQDQEKTHRAPWPDDAPVVIPPGVVVQRLPYCAPPEARAARPGESYRWRPEHGDFFSDNAVEEPDARS